MMESKVSKNFIELVNAVCYRKSGHFSISTYQMYIPVKAMYTRICLYVRVCLCVCIRIVLAENSVHTIRSDSMNPETRINPKPNKNNNNSE